MSALTDLAMIVSEQTDSSVCCKINNQDVLKLRNVKRQELVDRQIVVISKTHLTCLTQKQIKVYHKKRELSRDGFSPDISQQNLTKR